MDPWLDPATAVCTEMARRARSNIEPLVERLSAQGYRFHDNDDDRFAEGIFVGEVATPFVSCLNRVFTGGGFFGPQLPPW